MKTLVLSIAVGFAVLAYLLYGDTPLVGVARRLTMWGLATTILYASVKMIFWPRELVPNLQLGTTRPPIARAFGFLGLTMSFFFLAVAAFAAPYPFGWPGLLVGSLATIGIVGWLIWRGRLQMQSAGKHESPVSEANNSNG
ncbi:MAG: hypothetical protein AB9869_10465 [Verrucomicrobiia bacterium]